MTPREVLHVDMDAFFASVEQREDPSLRGRPILVGGASRRGVVAAASYEARAFGARSAMPMAEALRRCPEAVVVPPRHALYAEVSAKVFAIFHRYTPLVEGLSLDEAFLDVTASRGLFGDGASIARRIKDAVRGELGLTASAGVAPSKFVAKIASDLEKPDGLVVVPPERVLALLHPLPVGRMWGVGPKAQASLAVAGLRTIGDLARSSPARLESLLGSWGRAVHELARGVDDRPVVPDRDAVSIGAEITYDEDLEHEEAIAVTLLAHASRVAARLHAAERWGRVVVVKLKEHDFTLHTRQQRLDEPVADTDSIHRTARALLARFPLAGKRFRLTGVSVKELSAHGPAPSLFPDAAAARRRSIEALTASVNDRFGQVLTRASLVRGAGSPEPAPRPPRRR